MAWPRGVLCVWDGCVSWQVVMGREAGRRVFLRAAVCESHEPRLQGARLPFYICDADAERETFEGFYRG